MNAALGRDSDPNRLRGRNVLVMGLGTRQGGVGAARYAASAGANVRVTDVRTHEDLAEQLAELAGLPIGYTLGEHREEDFRWAEVVVRNPAVRRESPWLQLARRHGARVEMEMSLFLRACPAPVAGVTGTKGKTTTTTLLHAMLRTRYPGATLAGNMGRSALAALPAISGGEPVALEISSFQVEALDEHRLSPHVAVITNISEDHLDRYTSFAEYAQVKARLAAHQRAGDVLVIPADDTRIDDLTRGFAGARATFALERHAGERAVWIERDVFMARWNGELRELGPIEALQLPGEHARMNALAAAAAALALGVEPAGIRRAIAGFSGVRDRLEQVATIGDVTYVNDTAATAPAAAIAALRAYAGRDLVVIAGGSDKRVPLEGFAAELARHARYVLLLEGAVTPALQRLLVERGYAAIKGPFGRMDAAVDAASRLTRPGSVVLLSPGCASFGMFRDEFHRGDAFREAVARLAAGDAERGRQ